MRAPARSTSGSATRLLVLGCVRIFQPVHGYFLHRELISWNVDEWASVHPGSIYNALRSLARSGLLEEVQTGSVSARTARTTYRLTGAGEQEFGDLLRTALRETDDPATEVMRIIAARTAGELAWTTAYLAHVRAGGHSFTDEERTWCPTEAEVTETLQAGEGRVMINLEY